MKTQSKAIESFLGMFREDDATVITVSNTKELKAAMRRFGDLNFKFRGGGHSYNNRSTHKNIIQFEGEYNEITFQEETQTVRVGAGVTIRELEEFLLDRHLRLPNRGNFNRQTVVGAMMNGTHGYGDEPNIIDCVVAATRHGNCIENVTIKPVPLTRYYASIKKTRLSEFDWKHQETKRAYAVFPYSHPDDYTCILAEYYELPITEKEHQEWYHDHPTYTEPPWYLKAFWRLDHAVPPLRNMFQKVIHHLPDYSRSVITDIHDIDAIYDPFPGFQGMGDNWNPTLWAFRPAYTSYNMALFIRPEDTKDFIDAAVEKSRTLKRNMLTSFVSVRELRGKSHYNKAGNNNEPRNGVDFYCRPKDFEHMCELQFYLQQEFDTRRHFGKTVTRESLAERSKA